ncbi:DUF350 domain-containing protein [Vitiosangium sp. GDMCC 1.1324]|uniref:DUF350 domain-containing protein n=1 Tax=Vitiosangium sp. (strain GDMCC 1.1324) TaxID=2138576 RepID=UPI000D3A0486|nr:DUF350 domain-containing protein [Vitiosangium sp. GDMCC 1.1324]PTL83850.1 DUF350 domain-containing protein [Vitiosangium sp. GDMCC 1.1324]
MNLLLVAVGLSKVVFGGLVAALGIWLAFRGLNRLLGTADPTGDLRNGNVAAGVVHAASLLALGLLVQNAVSATFDAVDLTFHGPSVALSALARLAFFALMHVGVSLLVGTGVLALGVILFDKMTPGLDELAEVRRGNVALALVLAAILVVIALLTAPGLQATLNGLIPFPTLPPSTLRAPS